MAPMVRVSLFHIQSQQIDNRTDGKVWSEKIQCIQYSTQLYTWTGIASRKRCCWMATLSTCQLGSSRFPSCRTQGARFTSTINHNGSFRYGVVLALVYSSPLFRHGHEQGEKKNHNNNNPTISWAVFFFYAQNQIKVQFLVCPSAAID